MHHRKETTPLQFLAVWAALLVLLAVAVGTFYLPLGPFALPAGAAVALLKILLIVWFFMHTREESPLVRFFAGAGFVWLAVLGILTFSDYLTRDIERHSTRQGPPWSGETIRPQK